MPHLILLLLLIPNVTFAQSGSSMDVGDTTFFNFGDWHHDRRQL